MNVKLNSSDIILFTQNMAALLKSGLSLQNSLEVCGSINNKKQNAVLCNVLKKKIDEGETLSMGLRFFHKQFSQLYISLVEIGENIGSISEVFEKLSVYLKEKKETREKIIQALVYPIIVLLTALFVVAIIIFYVFPKLESVFEVFTESSEVVLLKVNGIKTGMMIFCASLLAVTIFLLVFMLLHKYNKEISFYIDKMLLKTPLIGKYIQTTCTNDFSFAMKLLCSSYIPFSESLEQAGKVVKNLYYKRAIEDVHRKIVSGCDIGTAFKEQKIFPVYLVTWISLAQSTGNVENVFTQISEYFKNETSNIVQGIVISAEPVFILITGIIIFILIGQFVIPIFKLLGAL